MLKSIKKFAWKREDKMPWENLDIEERMVLKWIVRNAVEVYGL
jgi:hypothetical protein